MLVALADHNKSRVALGADGIKLAVASHRAGNVDPLGIVGSISRGLRLVEGRPPRADERAALAGGNQADNIIVGAGGKLLVDQALVVPAVEKLERFLHFLLHGAVHSLAVLVDPDAGYAPNAVKTLSMPKVLFG